MIERSLVTWRHISQLLGKFATDNKHDTDKRDYSRNQTNELSVL